MNTGNMETQSSFYRVIKTQMKWVSSLNQKRTVLSYKKAEVQFDKVQDSGSKFDKV